MRNLLRASLALGALLDVWLLVAWLGEPSRVVTRPSLDPTALLSLVYQILPASSPVGSPTIWFYALLTAGGLEACALAMLLIVRAWDRPGVPPLATFLVSGTLFFAALLLATPHGRPSALTGWAHLPGAWLGALGLSAFLGVSLAALVTFAATFPKPITPDDVAAVLGPRERVFRIRPRMIWIEYTVATVAATAVVLLWPRLAVPWSFMFFPSIALGALFWTHQYLRAGACLSEGPDVRRIRWISGGVSASLWLWIAFGVLASSLIWFGGDWGVFAYMAGLFVYGPLAMAIVLVTSLGIAVLVGGVIDPDLAIRRTTVYGTLVLLFAFAFAVTEELLSGLLVSQLGVSDRVASVLLGATVALGVTPLKAMVDRLVIAWLPRTP